MLPQNGFGSLVIQDQTLCNHFQRTGRCALGTVDRAVNHEVCVCANLAFFRAEKGDGRGRFDLADVVEREGERQRPDVKSPLAAPQEGRP